MRVINFSEQNSVLNQYMAELRDKSYQKNRLLFRNNIERVGELMAYEVSRTLTYKKKTVTTPLGTIDIPLPKDDLVIATVLRAGLPFHQGFLNVFDHAENAFVSAYRMYTNRGGRACRVHGVALRQGQDARHCRSHAGHRRQHGSSHRSPLPFRQAEENPHCLRHCSPRRHRGHKRSAA